MPFAIPSPNRQNYPENHWREVYSGLLRPAVEDAGLSCHRDDDDFSSRPISLNIWKKIEESDIILCDISSSNPNVFFELGWAVRAEKPYVIAMDEITKAPFDIGDFNRFEYNRTLRPLALKEQIPRLSKMLRDTLLDPGGRWSILRNLQITSPRSAQKARPRCKVDIYYHERAFTRKHATDVAEALQAEGIEFRLLEHTGPTQPDAIFIGSCVQAGDARRVLRLVPYEIKFLFRPDYPESEGGDNSGYTIGLGYTSQYNLGLRIQRAEPIPLSSEDLSALLDENHTNASFHRQLWEFALGYSR
jgi:hypothetical protein